MALQVVQVLVGGFDKNCSYIIYDDQTAEALVVDPSGDWPLVVERVAQLQVQVVGILLTHTHPDHVDALESALELFSVPVFVHDEGRSAITAPTVELLVDGSEILLGDQVIAALYTPGHSQDSLCYLFTADSGTPVIISGDTLFIDGCGRTRDTAVRELFTSLQRLKTLPVDTVVLPGHDYGPVAIDTLENQLQTNQFLQADSFADFCLLRLGYTITE